MVPIPEQTSSLACIISADMSSDGVKTVLNEGNTDRFSHWAHESVNPVLLSDHDHKRKVLS